MKSFVIAYDSGREIYTDLEGVDDNPMLNPHMIGAMISSLSSYLNLFNEQWKIIKTNSFLFLFSQRNNVHFFAVTNNINEKEIILNLQIDHIENILSLLYSHSIFQSNSISSNILTKLSHKKNIYKILTYIKSCFLNDISYYLMCLRKLPLQSSILSYSSIREIMRKYHSKIEHILVFIDKNIIINVSRYTNDDKIEHKYLLAINSILLSNNNDDKTLFDNHLTSSLLPNSITPLSELQKQSSSFYSPRYLIKFSQSFSNNLIVKNKLSNDFLNSNDITNTSNIQGVNKTIQSKSNPLISEIDDYDDPFQLEEDYITYIKDNTSKPEHIPFDSVESDDDDTKDDSLLVNFSPIEPIGVPINNKSSNINNRESEYSSNIQNQPTNTRQANSSSIPTQTINIYENNILQTYRMYSLYLKKTFNMAILVNIKDNNNDNTNDYQQMIKLQEENRKIQELKEYFDNKFNSNITKYYQKQSKIQWQYFLTEQMNYCPGLVHFIIIRRSDNSLFSPEITSLTGNLYNDKYYKDNQIKYLTKEIKKLIVTSQYTLLNGYHTMLLTNGKFKYFYHLWMEDLSLNNSTFMKEYDKISIKVPVYNNNDKEVFLSTEWYKNNIKYSTKTNNNRICYELYALYLYETNNANIILSTNNIVKSFFKIQNEQEYCC